MIIEWPTEPSRVSVAIWEPAKVCASLVKAVSPVVWSGLLVEGTVSSSVLGLLTALVNDTDTETGDVASTPGLHDNVAGAELVGTLDVKASDPWGGGVTWG